MIPGLDIAENDVLNKEEVDLLKRLKIPYYSVNWLSHHPCGCPSELELHYRGRRQEK